MRRRTSAIRSVAVVAAVAATASAALATTTPTLTVLATFTTANGAYPGSVLLDSSGGLYGTTYSGGAANAGTVFHVSAAGHSLTTVATFNTANGANPFGGLTADASGNLYGLTVNGGANGSGTAFEIAAGGGSITTLASFSTAGGASPAGILSTGGVVSLYETTSGGGNGGTGTVLRIPVAGGPVTTVATFNTASGLYPSGPFTADNAGKLYGTTTGRGANGYGGVFRISGGLVTTLASFDNYTTGYGSSGGLRFDAAGDLYGTTQTGGVGGNGTVFELPAGGGPLQVLASFVIDKNNGGLGPITPVTVDAAGDLFGTTSRGGQTNDGTVYEVTAGTHSLVTLFSFSATVNGTDPNSALVADTAGNLYGTTDLSGGPAGQVGTVFELTGTGFVVPEPASLGVLAIAAAGLLGRRRRRA